MFCQFPSPQMAGQLCQDHMTRPFGFGMHTMAPS
ncbi:hypothetical protein ID866_8374 [Astraeus odoratus]|nr:hypothetical protein ID866_8374 [Astraeus odoratus]